MLKSVTSQIHIIEHSFHAMRLKCADKEKKKEEDGKEFRKQKMSWLRKMYVCTFLGGELIKALKKRTENWNQKRARSQKNIHFGAVTSNFHSIYRVTRENNFFYGYFVFKGRTKRTKHINDSKAAAKINSEIFFLFFSQNVSVLPLRLFPSVLSQWYSRQWFHLFLLHCFLLWHFF